MTREGTVPDHTAVRVALWRAMHVQVDPPPHVLEDEIGLQLVSPDEGWRQRPDMDPRGTMIARAAVVARARFVEELVMEQLERGVTQYVILGAGLDTFAQRRPDVASRLQIYEVEQPETQAWKRGRLLELGYTIPPSLHLVPVDFEARQSWPAQLANAGFDPARPAVISSNGVSMYLSKEANAATLRQVASMAAGTTLVMTYLLPLELIEPEHRPFLDMSMRGAAAAGTPFLSIFHPDEWLAMARDAGFSDVRNVTSEMLNQRYFAGRTDGLKTSRGEELLVAFI